MNVDLTRKKHYTFEQVANLLQCNVENLRYYVIAGELSPSLYLSGRQLPEYLMSPGEHYDTDGHVEPHVLTSTKDHDYGVAQISFPIGFFHLVRGRQTSAFDCEFQFAASKPNGFDIGDVVFMLESPIRLDEVFETCVVMATELDRFKASHSFSQTPTILAKPPAGEHAAPGNQPPVASQLNPEPHAPSEIGADPTDLPKELDAANIAFRAVLNGYGKHTATRRNRTIAYLKENYKDFKPDAIKRIATVANPDKTTGRKKFPDQ